MTTPRIVLAVLLALALVQSCAKEPHTPSQNQAAPMTDPCKDALTRFANQDWLTWDGLPTCSLDDVKATFPALSDANGRARIGTKPVTTEFKTLPLDGFKKPIKVWYRGSDVIMLEVEYPAVEDPAAAFSALGEPAAKLDYHQRTVLYAASAHVYPKRGLAVLFNPDQSAVIRIYLFAATELDEYQKTLHHPTAPARRLPRR